MGYELLTVNDMELLKGYFLEDSHLQDVCQGVYEGCSMSQDMRTLPCGSCEVCTVSRHDQVQDPTG